MYILRDIKNRDKHKAAVSDIRYFFLRPSRKALYRHVEDHIGALIHRTKYKEEDIDVIDDMLSKKAHNYNDHHNDHKASWGHDVGWDHNDHGDNSDSDGGDSGCDGGGDGD